MLLHPEEVTMKDSSTSSVLAPLKKASELVKNISPFPVSRPSQEARRVEALSERDY